MGMTKGKPTKTFSLPRKCCSCLSEQTTRRVKIGGWGLGTFYRMEVPVCDRCYQRINRHRRSYDLFLLLFTLFYLLFAIANPIGPWQTTVVVYFWLYFLILIVLLSVLDHTPLGKHRPATLKFGRLKFRNREYQRLFLKMNREKMMFKE